MVRRPFILVEGSDGTGKTALADALRDRGWGYVHYGAPDYAPLDYYLDGIAPYAEGGVVIDRMHPSSFVYGTVFRGTDDLTPYEHWILDGTLLSFNSILIYANPPDVAAVANVAKGPADDDARIYEVEGRQVLVRQLYRVYMERMAVLPMLEYDFTSDRALERMVTEVESLVDYFDGTPSPLKDAVGAVGNCYSPQFCFVGASPSQYLFRTLLAAGVSLNRVALVRELPDTFKMSEFWLNTDVIALGADADSKLTAMRLEHRAVPHPDDVERLHYREILRYSRALLGEEEWVEMPTLVRAGFVVPRR